MVATTDGVRGDLSDFDIRIAGESDFAAIANVRWGPTDPACDSEFERRMSEWLSAEGERRTTWLAWIGEQPIGMASLFEYRRMPRPGRPDSRWGYLGNMFVCEHFRNQGVGSALLAAIIAAAEERHYARLVLSPSEAAVRLYRRAGFIVPDESATGHRLLLRPAGALPR